MRKIPTLYLRSADDPRRVTALPHPDCHWVLAGEGTATRKFDGTCVMLDENGRWWARREIKAGKTPPPNFVEAEHDSKTGKTQGWIPIEDSSFAEWHTEALESVDGAQLDPGTYELIGPKINSNPEQFHGHALILHGKAEFSPGMSPRELIEFCRERGWEGVVYHHPDGRMAKLKVRDCPVDEVAEVIGSEISGS